MAHNVALHLLYHLAAFSFCSLSCSNSSRKASRRGICETCSSKKRRWRALRPSACFIIWQLYHVANPGAVFRIVPPNDGRQVHVSDGAFAQPGLRVPNRTLLRRQQPLLVVHVLACIRFPYAQQCHRGARAISRVLCAGNDFCVLQRRYLH